MNGRVVALVAAGVLSVSTNVFAQTGGTGAVQNPGVAAGAAVAPEPLRFGRNVEHSLGARFWIWTTPV